MDIPIISICIPTYEMQGKGLKFLQHALQSIKIQSFKSIEVIVSDNSKDKDIENYCQGIDKDLRLTYLRNSLRIGISANLNFAIEHARGTLIKILFQDDFFFDNHSLFNLYKAWGKGNSKWLLSASEHSLDGKTYYLKMIPKYNSKIFLGNNTISSPSVLMFLKEDAPLFDENLTWLMDCDYYKSCFSKFGPPSVCENITIVNRVGSHQVSQSKITKEIQINELKYIMKKYVNDVTIIDRIKVMKYQIPVWLYKFFQRFI